MTITFTATLELVHCADCGVPFGITDSYMHRRREDHAAFYCPSGHVNVYRAQTEAERERDRRVKAEQQLEQARSARIEAEKQAATARATAKRETTKRKKVEHRVACGVCPKCNRTFSALARHIKSKHPEFAASSTVEG